MRHPDRRADAADAARRDFPAVVRRAAHDLTQPLQAVRMMLDLPGVLADDGRGLPGKVNRALAELDRRLTQLQRLARRLDGGAEAEPPRPVFLAEIIDLARSDRPDLWDERTRCPTPARTVVAAPRDAAMVLNALVENARRARARRIVVGARGDGRRIVVADDGEGMSAGALAALAGALAGGDAAPLGGGLFLSRLLVAGWGGGWSLRSRPSAGTCVAFSLPA